MELKLDERKIYEDKKKRSNCTFYGIEITILSLSTQWRPINLIFIKRGNMNAAYFKGSNCTGIEINYMDARTMGYRVLIVPLWN